MQLLDIDIISKGIYTWPFQGLSGGEKHRAQLSGISEAVSIKTTTPGQYEIVGNPKSWYLAQAIQVHQIPTINVDHLNESELLELAKPVSEKPGIIEQAKIIANLLPQYKSKAALGRAHNLTRSQVCNYARIHTLADDIKKLITSNPTKILLGHAKVIAGLEHKQQPQLANDIIQHNLSVHATEQKARQMKIKGVGRTDDKPVEALKLEQGISEHIGCPTTIDVEKGRLIIDYQKNIDVLDGVLVHLGYLSD